LWKICVEVGASFEARQVKIDWTSRDAIRVDVGGVGGWPSTSLAHDRYGFDLCCSDATPFASTWFGVGVWPSTLLAHDRYGFDLCCSDATPVASTWAGSVAVSGSYENRCPKRLSFAKSFA